MDENKKLLFEVWRWLPVFRSVAETESVTKAAKAFSVSPPAVSRALAQIEEALDRQLFDRRGRSLSLNPHGYALLSAVTQAEDRLLEVITELGAKADGGHVRLATMGQFGRVFIAPALREVHREHPQLQVSLVHLQPSDALERLKNHTLDLFLALNVAVGEPLVGTWLGDLEMGIYAGRGHPLYGSREVSVDEIAKHAFAAQLRPGLMRSVWPNGVRRIVSLQTDAHAVALDACLSGSHLMVMERVIAQSLLESERLCEINATLIPSARLVLCRHSDQKRSSLSMKVAKAIGDLVKAQLAAAS